MKKTITGRREFLSAGLMAASLLALPNSEAAPDKIRITGLASKSLSPFDEMLKRFMEERDISAASLAVTCKSRLVYARGFSSADPVTPRSLFRLASVSKPITAVAVMLLVQQGHVALTDKLVDFVPMKSMDGKKRDSRLDSITIRNLLQHQGGWDRDASFDPMFRDIAISKVFGIELPITRKHIITYMAGHPLDFDPGTKYAYSNFGYCLLGRVIEAVTGKTYEQFVKEEVLAPLGIKEMRIGHTLKKQRAVGEVWYETTDTKLRRNVNEKGAPQNALNAYGAWNLENMDAHGAWLASAADLVRFASAMDPSGDYPLLNRDTIKEMFAPPPTGSSPGGHHYGCGWTVRPAGNSLNTWHGGSLPGTHTLLVRRHDGLNWAILLNRRDSPSGLSFGAIDGLLHQAANAVKTWPEHDLFSEFEK